MRDKLERNLSVAFCEAIRRYGFEKFIELPAFRGAGRRRKAARLAREAAAASLANQKTLVEPEAPAGVPAGGLETFASLGRHCT